MKLQNMTLFCALIVALCSTSAAAQRRTTSSALDRSPEIVVKEFYKWYIHSVSHQIDPFKAGKTTLKKYVTLRFIRKIERIAKEMASEGYDGDYFLEAQGTHPDSPDLEDEWIKNISLSRVAVRGATATAPVLDLDDGCVDSLAPCYCVLHEVWYSNAQLQTTFGHGPGYLSRDRFSVHFKWHAPVELFRIGRIDISSCHLFCDQYQSPLCSEVFDQCL